MYITNFKKEKGFTIIEAIVSIAIFVTAVTATMLAAQKAISNSIFAKQQVQAFFLANEVVEYLRNARDTNIITGSHWLHGFAELSSDACAAGKTCRIDTQSTTNQFVTCSGGSGSCPNLSQNSSTKLIGYTGSGTWVATPFRREIQISNVSANEILVSVEVTWTKGLLSKTFTLKESIFKWQ